MGLIQLIQHRGQLLRLAEIIRVLGRYGLADWLNKVPVDVVRKLLASREMRAYADQPLGVRARQALAELGTTFIKFGQVLSTRPDLVGPDVASELAQLQDQTPADSPDAVRRTIVAELGQPPEELFGEFEAEPLASASIGQVHRARLLDGRRVIVKVQHEGIQDKVRSDLELLLALAELLQQHVSATRPYQPVATAREFQRTLLRELDFSCERRNLEQFARNFAQHKTVHFPAVHAALSSRRVLTMEMLLGVQGNRLEELRQSGEDLGVFARRAAEMYLHMIFRDGFYHADPHPGNFMLLPGCVVGVFDCGMVGRIDEPLREMFGDLLLCVMRRDSEELADLLLRVGSAPADTERDAFRAEVSDFIAVYGLQSISEFDLGGAMDQLTAIVRRHHIVLPSSVSLLLKTLVMLEGTARALSPEFSLVELMTPYQRRLLRDRLRPRRWLQKLWKLGRDVDRLVTHGARDVTDILGRLRSGTFEIKHEHHRLESTVNRLVAGILTAALFLGSSLILSRAVPPLIYGVSAFGAAGCLAAVGLGVRLYRAVSKNFS